MSPNLWDKDWGPDDDVILRDIPSFPNSVEYVLHNMYFDDCLKEDTEADTENTSLKIQMAMSGVKEIL